MKSLISLLLPLATVITPNIPEAEVLNDAVDLLYENENIHWYSSERINNSNTHGTGCTLSSAIACNLADGKNLDESIKNAKEYLTGSLAAMLDLGKGSGPLNHMYTLSIV